MTPDQDFRRPVSRRLRAERVRARAIAVRIEDGDDLTQPILFLAGLALAVLFTVLGGAFAG